MIHSFVIPAFGDSKYLEECIISLINQSVKSNIIIYTSTPSNYIENLAKKYNLKLINNFKGSSGIGEDWNNAMKCANTELITLAHQDDIYLSDYTYQIIKMYKKHRNSLIFFTNYSEFIENVENIKKFNINLFIKRLFLIPFLFQKSYQCKIVKKFILKFGSCISTPTVTYNMNMLKDFKFNEFLKVNLDWLAYINLANSEGAFTYLPLKLVLHRLHSSTETLLNIKKGIRKREDFYILKLIWGDLIARFLLFFYTFAQYNHLIENDKYN